MRSFFVAVAGALAVFVILLVAYFAALPVIISNHYTQSVHNVARPLDRSFKELDKSVDLPLLTDPDVPLETKKQNAVHIVTLIQTTCDQIDLLRVVNSRLALMPYSNAFGGYGDSLVLHSRVESFVGQTNAALDEYESLTRYLEAFAVTQDRAESALNDFNAVSDLNTLAGQSEKMRQIAGGMRSDSDTLSKAKPPSEVADMNVAMIKALDEAAGGFDEVAGGLAIPADSPIDAGAHQIEAATSDIDTIMSTLYGTDLSQSRTVKNIQDFSEKLDLVLGT